MNKHDFTIIGSSGDEYQMYVASNDTGRYTVRCFCKAGKYGGLCKHALAIASFDFESLGNPDDEVSIRKILEPTSIVADLEVKIREQKAIEKEISQLNRKKKKLKTSIAEILGISKKE